MLHILNDSHDPAYNLALEEYFLTHPQLTGNLVILWRNQPTVVIGRNQNFAAEVNEGFIKDRQIRVVRRLSGGGAVYHDLGNLNFSFITALSAVGHNNFAYFTQSIVNVLSKLNVKAEFTGRNDLTIDGQKFSGNAQYIHRNRLLHHGTLLFDTDMAVLAQALAGTDAKHVQPAVPSVRSKITNLRRHLPVGITLEDFSASLLRTIFADAATPYRGYTPTGEDSRAIELLADNQYRDLVWTYGRQIPYNQAFKRAFAGGTVQVLLDIEAAAIRQCKIHGDFFSDQDMDELAAQLIGLPYRRDDIFPCLAGWLSVHPIRDISARNMLDCFFPAAPKE